MNQSMKQTAPFIDEKTMGHIAWNKVWQMIRPVHELGNQFKQTVQPFLPGDESLWLRQTSFLQALYQWVKDEPAWLTECREILQKAPDILVVLQILESHSMLQVSDVFTLKQWLLYGRELTEKWKQVQLLQDAANSIFIRLNLFNWEAGLHYLQPLGSITPTFAWADLQDSRLVELSAKRIELEQKIAQQRIRQNKSVYEKVGIRPDRERRVVIQKPIYDANESYQKQRDACFQCEHVAFQAETINETIFVVVDTAELQLLREQLEQLQSDILQRQHDLLQQLSIVFSKELQKLKQAADEFAKLDYFLAAIRFALPWDTFCFGQLDDAALEEKPLETFGIEIKNGWHPVYRLQHEQANPAYKWTAIELCLTKVNVLTGPNMGGKSVTLHTIALLQTLFQFGLPLPAASYTASFYKWVRYHGGDDSDAGSGISSFAAEMIRLSEILQLTGRGLVLFDELARSTNPDEGGALAAAIVDTAFERNSLTVCASHFSHVGQVPNVSLFQVKGLQESPLLEKHTYVQTADGDQDKLLEYLQKQMNYEWIRVGYGHVPQYAFTIAEFLGLPSDILERGQNYLQRRKK